MKKKQNIKELLLQKGHTENLKLFSGAKDLEEMRKVILHYLHPYLLYESKNLSTKQKLSSCLDPEKKVPKSLMDEVRNEVRQLVKKFNNSENTRKVFEKILDSKNISPCEGFYDFRANLSGDYKVSTGWHQDCETSFVEGKKYWNKFSCTAWITLTEANKNNSILIVPRQNRKLLKIYPQHYGQIGNVDYRQKELGDIDNKIKTKDVYAVTADADECVLIDSFVLHRTVPGNTNKSRFSIDIRYYASDYDLSKKIRVHPKLYYFRFLKSKSYLKIRNSKALKPFKILKKIIKR